MFFIIFILSLVCNIVLADDNKDNTKRLIGNYVKLSVNNDSGRMTIYGRNSTKDKWMPLIFEDSNGTSYFRFFMNGVRIPFGEGGSNRYSEIKIEGDKILYFWKNNKVLIELSFFLTKTVSIKYADTLILELTVKNIDYKKIKLDYYFCIDTYLGEKEKNHFILSDGTIIKSEYSIAGKSSLQFITSYSAKSKLGISVFLPQKTNIPDNILFTNWKKMDTDGLEYPIMNGRSFDLKPYSINDSAISFVYTNKSIDKDAEYKNKFVFKMINKIDESDIIKKNQTDKTNHSTTTTINNTNMNNNDKLNLINMSLSDLLALLDSINKKLENGVTLSDQDVEYSKQILDEIKRRRNYK